MRVQFILEKYDYRVHWGKFFHASPAIWKTFGNDLEDLKAEIEETNSHRFLNCWTSRHLYGESTCSISDSNYERLADKFDENASQKQAQST